MISADLRDLREKSKLSKDVYLKDRDAQAVVERRVQTATESCINIANHLIARLGLRAPQDCADAFRSLREAQILTEGLADQMAELARFRNLLVHLYWELDHGKVHDHLLTRIGTIKVFMERVAQWLRENRESEGA